MRQSKVERATPSDNPISLAIMDGLSGEKLAKIAYPIGAILATFGVWQWAVHYFAIPRLILPAPSEIFADLFYKWNIYFDFMQPTLSVIIVGFIVAAVSGIALGMLVSFSPLANRTLYPLMVSSQMVPKVAIAPVFIIWFGTGITAKVLISFLIAFFPIMISTMVGLESIEPDMVKLFRSMGAGPLRTFFKLRLPGALPNIFAGLKIGMSMAVVGAVVGEFVAADRGLGYYLIYANGQLDTVGVFSSLMLLTALGVALYYLVELSQRLFIPTALIKGGDLSRATM